MGSVEIVPTLIILSVLLVLLQFRKRGRLPLLPINACPTTNLEHYWAVGAESHELGERNTQPAKQEKVEECFSTMYM